MTDAYNEAAAYDHGWQDGFEAGLRRAVPQPPQEPTPEAVERAAEIAALRARAEVMHRRAQKAEGAINAALAEAEIWGRVYSECNEQEQARLTYWRRLIIADVTKRLQKAKDTLTAPA